MKEITQDQKIFLYQITSKISSTQILYIIPYDMFDTDIQYLPKPFMTFTSDPVPALNQHCYLGWLQPNFKTHIVKYDLPSRVI